MKRPKKYTFHIILRSQYRFNYSSFHFPKKSRSVLCLLRCVYQWTRPPGCAAAARLNYIRKMPPRIFFPIAFWARNAPPPHNKPLSIFFRSNDRTKLDHFPYILFQVPSRTTTKKRIMWAVYAYVFIRIEQYISVFKFTEAEWNCAQQDFSSLQPASSLLYKVYWVATFFFLLLA